MSDDQAERQDSGLDDRARGRLLELLEARRLAVDGSLWRTAGIFVAAQAFLLLVIADRTVGWEAASAVAAAGVVLSATCFVALRKQVKLEEVLSAEVSRHAIILFQQDPRWYELPAAKKAKTTRGMSGAQVLFPSALGILAVADIVALVAQR